MVGRTLGGFSVEGEIGRGGMGEVLLARQNSLGRPVVLKRILKDLADQPELAERFQREARSAGAVHHHNVVAVYDLFTHRGAQYIAQEYVDGADLATALLIEAPLPWRIASLLALEVARGLEAVHAHGTLHRDLKPANLLLGRRGEVKITDFGLAIDSSASTLTLPGVALGTPAYMAPEQLRCERVDARTDVFAFGCVLYEMLTGAPPFPARSEGSGPANGKAGADAGSARGEAPATLVERIARGRYRSVRRAARGVPRPLARMVERCLRAKPKRRVASARALRQGLEALLGSPSPADCQAELASWLWERGLFEPRSDQTVVLVADTPRAAPRGRVRPWLAATALVAAAACIALALSRPQAVMRWTDDAVAATRAAAEAPVTRIAVAARSARSAPDDR
jgi:serine/threonine-protein kinase